MHINHICSNMRTILQHFSLNLYQLSELIMGKNIGPAIVPYRYQLSELILCKNIGFTISFHTVANCIKALNFFTVKFYHDYDPFAPLTKSLMDFTYLPYFCRRLVVFLCMSCTSNPFTERKNFFQKIECYFFDYLFAP